MVVVAQIGLLASKKRLTATERVGLRQTPTRTFDSGCPNRTASRRAELDKRKLSPP